MLNLSRKAMKTNTTKKRLTIFLVSVMGTVALLCAFSLFCFEYINYKYQRTADKVTTFNEYYHNLNLVMDLERQYFKHEGKDDYINILEYLDKLDCLLNELRDDVNDVGCLNEIQDITEMTESYKLAVNDVANSIDNYHRSSDDFDIVNDNFEKVEHIYLIIKQEYNNANKIFLDYVNSEYERLDFNKTIVLLFILIFFLGACKFLYSEVKNIYRSIVNPIQSLINAAEGIRKVDLYKSDINKSVVDHNINVLMDVFNNMVDQLESKIVTLQEKVIIEKELEESRFKELQMQINPHFMFNTLNMLVGTAYLENADKTAHLLNVTAKMFRYSLDFSGRSVSLYKEIEALGNYIYILEQRFGDRITFIFELDERFHGIKIPSLILQPLVENSIIHGINMMTHGAIIWIRTIYKEDEKKGYIIVEDNGSGIEENKLSQVINDMQQTKQNTGKIGLGNVYMRLKIHFSNQVTMDIYSKEAKGTKVSISINYQKGEEMDV